MIVFAFKKLLVSLPLTFFINNAVFASEYKCNLTTFDGRDSELKIIPKNYKYVVISDDINFGDFRVIDNTINFLHIFSSVEDENLSMHIGINKQTNKVIFNLMDFKVTDRPVSQVKGFCQKS